MSKAYKPIVITRENLEALVHTLGFEWNDEHGWVWFYKDRDGQTRGRVIEDGIINVVAVDTGAADNGLTRI